MLIKIREYVAIGGLILINITAFMGFIYVLFPNDTTMIAGVLAFAGSIIGGSLTLIGVKWTLEKQANDRYVDEFPKKRQSLTVIISHITKLTNLHNPLLDYYNGPSEREIALLFDELKNEATKIDGIVYNMIVEFEVSIHIYVSRVKSNQIYQDDRVVRPSLTEESSIFLKRLREELITTTDEKLKELQHYGIELDIKYIEITDKRRR